MKVVNVNHVRIGMTVSDPVYGPQKVESFDKRQYTIVIYYVSGLRGHFTLGTNIGVVE